MISKIIIISLIGMAVVLAIPFLPSNTLNVRGAIPEGSAGELNFWEIRSIDTMKYSRDAAREKLDDSSFDLVIDAQMSAIASTGATHVAIGTPYDEEFLPFLKRWTASARKHGLSVWYRSNWSGWEGWFSYPKINREEHITKTQDFILQNPDLFEDGDIFTACVECENGGPGDPRMNGDAKGHREFLIREHDIMEEAFGAIDKDVIFNYNSMNGDVARLIMDKQTTRSLGGVVTIDHYVKTTDRLADDIINYAKDSEAKVVLGEFGAPIPDIHGKLTPANQAKWVEDALTKIVKGNKVEALNYWTAVGGTTELWDSKMRPRPIVEVIRNFYDPPTKWGSVTDESGKVIVGATISLYGRIYASDDSGFFEFPYIPGDSSNVLIYKKDYKSQEISLNDIKGDYLLVALEPEKRIWWWSIVDMIKKTGNFFLNN